MKEESYFLLEYSCVTRDFGFDENAANWTKISLESPKTILISLKLWEGKSESEVVKPFQLMFC